MNLGEIKSRAWWAIDDNETTPTEISATVMAQLVNDAIRDLAPSLNIVKSATPTFTSGVASLPADFISPVSVYDGTTLLHEIHSVTDKVADTAATSQYFIPNNTEIDIFGITPTGTVTLWYKGSPTALSADADIPSEVPLKFHPAIAEIYVKAKYYAKLGRNYDAASLMNEWEALKKEVNGYTNHDRKADGDLIQDVYYDPAMYGGGSW